MTLRPNATDALEMGRRERPAAPVRKGERHDAEPRAAAWRPRTSARLSFAQLLRAGLLVFVGSLCVAFLQSGAAKAEEPIARHRLPAR